MPSSRPSPPPTLAPPRPDPAAFNDEVIAAINAEGTAFFSGTTFNGRRAMRISVSNWQTSPDDVRKTVAAVARVLHTFRTRALATR